MNERKPDKPRPGRIKALGYALIYMVLAALWILFSGRALDLLTGLEAFRTELEIYKGWLFVLITGCALYAILRTWQGEQFEVQPSVAPSERQPIRWRNVGLPLTYLLGMVLIIVSGGYVVFERLKISESSKIEHNLAAVALLKAEQVGGWLHQNVDFATAAGNGSFLAESFGQWARAGNLSAERRRWVEARLRTLRQSYPYGDISLHDLQGRLYLHSDTASADAPAPADDLFQQVIAAKRPVIGKMRWRETPDGGRSVSLPMAAPLLPSGRDGPVVGILLFELNPEKYLYNDFNSWPRSGESAEMALLHIDGDHVTLLNEMRLRKGMVLSQEKISDDTSRLMAQIVGHKSGVVRGKDYRGVEVLGYVAPIAGIDWLVAAKVDTQETELPIRKIAVNIGLTALLLVLIGSLSLYFWWRQRKARYETAQISAKLEQQRLESRVDFLSKYANDIIILTDENGRIIEANDRALAVYGYAHHELLGMQMTELAAQEPTAEQRAAYRQALMQQKSLLLEAMHKRRDGTLFPVEASMRLIETERGMYLQAINRDISERKQAEAALRESEDQFRTIAASAQDAIIMMDADGFIMFWNPAAESIFGYSQAEVMGRNLHQLLAPERYLAAFDAGFAKFRSTGQGAAVGRKLELSAFRKDGVEIPIELSLSAVRRKDQWVAISIVRDISERKAIEMHERRLKNALRVLGTINGALMRLEDDTTLFPLVCRTAVEFGEMALAWVGVINAEGDRIVPLARDGRASNYLDEISVSTMPDAPESHGPVGTTYREDRVVVINDFQRADIMTPWRNKALTYGLNSIATFPIRRGGKIYAVLAVYSDQIGAFDDEVVKLFERMAAGISFALENFDREALRRQAEENQRMAAKVFESSHGGIMITDSRSRIVAVNPAFTLMTGYEAQEVIGQTPAMLRSGRQGPDFYREFRDELSRDDHWQGEMWNRRKNGEEYVTWLSVSALRDASGDVVQYIGIADDITEIKESQSRIEFLAYHDALTGLPNRMLANDRLVQGIAHAHRLKTRVAVMFLDLDDFKTINDTLGHSTGDRMLTAVADRLTLCVRESDTVSRQGGDEFLVMLNDVDELDAINNIAVSILEKISKPYLIDEHELSISTSIGIAVYPDDGLDCDTLLKNADMAMYNAKQSGRNTHRFFTEEMNDYVLEHLLIRNGLMRGLEHDEFRLHYQPQLDLADGCLIGVEALIRWQHPELGMVPPNRFIPVAEESGMIVPIGEWVLREACRQMHVWHQSGGAGLVVSVNISAVQFRRGDLEQVVSAALAESGLQPEFLELELTESILIQDVEKSLDIIRRLKELGVRLSIDDFGTGYSSLAYLRQLPVDKLKIDQSFVREIVTRQDDAAIALSIITLAHTLQKRVIAEGVETTEQLRFMQQHGCDEIQGYLFSRPLTSEAFEAFISRDVSLDSLFADEPEATAAASIG